MPALLGNRASFTFTVEGCGEELGVVRFDGHEAISSLYEFRLEIASDELVIEDLVGRPALLTIDGLGGERHVHGFVCQAEYIGDSRRHALYELTLVPWIWRLQQRASCRIFQHKSTPDIIAAVLEASGLARKHVRLALQGQYAARDYCTQYGETDLDLIHRLMEADGIYYYFEHSEDQHTLVLTDSPQCEPPEAGKVELTWGPPQGIVPTGEHLTHLRITERMRPTRVALRDMNLHTPEASLVADAGTDTARELYEYPGSFQEAGKGGPERGGQQARLRLEALQAARRRGFGTSDCPRLLVGHAFTITGHPRGGVDDDYRLVRLTHRGEQPQVLEEDAAKDFHYSNELECMGRKVPYRAPRITPRPTVRGLQTATVVGPAGEEVHVDEHGRVKVKFHWDREEATDETCSCWVRVSQMWAGNGFGAMFLPRIGHEVIVDFIEGDPDRPLITGRIYTGFNKPPYPLPDEKTKSTIKSDSSPGGGGSNELRFEDATGREEVYLHGQRDLTIAVEHDESLTVGNDRSKRINNDEREEIQHDRTIKVGNAHTETIGADMKLTVGANLDEKVGGGQTLQVGDNLTESAGKNIVLRAGNHLTVTTGANVNISSGAATRLVVGSKMSIACGTTTITIEPSGVNIKTAGVVNVEGSAVAVKGSVIKLN